MDPKYLSRQSVHNNNFAPEITKTAPELMFSTILETSKDPEHLSRWLLHNSNFAPEMSKSCSWAYVFHNSASPPWTPNISQGNRFTTITLLLKWLKLHQNSCFPLFSQPPWNPNISQDGCFTTATLLLKCLNTAPEHTFSSILQALQWTQLSLKTIDSQQ